MRCQWRSQNAETKLRTSKGETTVSSNYSLQVCPFSKWELLLKERICSQRERILSFKSSSLRYGKSLLPHLVSSIECYYFYYARAYTTLWALCQWMLQYICKCTLHNHWDQDHSRRRNSPLAGPVTTTGNALTYL